jgi:hypothetical protein
MTLLNPDLAEQRARASIAAAESIRSNMMTISDSCNWAQEDEVVLAIIRRDLTFGGALILPLNRLREQVLSLQEVGWSVVFSPGATDNDIEARCDKMAKLAQAKLDVIQRWRDNHSQ